MQGKRSTSCMLSSPYNFLSSCFVLFLSKGLLGLIYNHIPSFILPDPSSRSLSLNCGHYNIFSWCYWRIWPSRNTIRLFYAWTFWQKSTHSSNINKKQWQKHPIKVNTYFPSSLLVIMILSLNNYGDCCCVKLRKVGKRHAVWFPAHSFSQIPGITVPSELNGLRE